MPVRSVFYLSWQVAIIELAAVCAYAQEAPKKAPVPNDAAQAEALKLVKEVYGEELAAAKTAEQKRALAKKLLAKADATPDDLAGKYALLKSGKSIAMQALDAETAFSAIDKMADSFAVDALELKTGVLSSLPDKVHSTAERASLAGLALGLQMQAAADEKFDAAQQIGNLALAEAREAHDARLVRQAQAQTEDVQEKAKIYGEAKSAQKTLEKTPDDPQANLAVGKYHCFVKGDWDKGIPMLALAKDEDFSGLAQKDLVGAASPAEQEKLGDGWWGLADKQTGAIKTQMQRRAAYW